MSTNTVTLKVYSQEGKEVSTLPVSSTVFASEIYEQAMFNAVTVYLANRRQATAKTKKRSEVSGGGKKPFRQKGTGRARAGSSRSPIWVGGGTVFGPTGVQNFKLKQNKKEHRAALRSAITTKVNDLIVLDKLTVEGRTKEIVKVLEAFKSADSKVLLVSADEKVNQAANNLPNVQLVTNNNISVYDLLNNDKVIMLVDDVKYLEEELVNA